MISQYVWSTGGKLLPVPYNDIELWKLTKFSKHAAERKGLRQFKFACCECIKGHRSGTCQHTERPLIFIKERGQHSNSKLVTCVVPVVTSEKLKFVCPPRCPKDSSKTVLKCTKTCCKDCTTVILDMPFVKMSLVFDSTTKFKISKAEIPTAAYLGASEDRRCYRRAELESRGIFDDSTIAKACKKDDDIYSENLLQKYLIRRGIDVEDLLKNLQASSKNREPRLEQDPLTSQSMDELFGHLPYVGNTTQSLPTTSSHSVLLPQVHRPLRPPPPPRQPSHIPLRKSIVHATHTVAAKSQHRSRKRFFDSAKPETGTIGVSMGHLSMLTSPPVIMQQYGEVFGSEEVAQETVQNFEQDYGQQYQYLHANEAEQNPFGDDLCTPTYSDQSTCQLYDLNHQQDNFFMPPSSLFDEIFGMPLQNDSYGEETFNLVEECLQNSPSTEDTSNNTEIPQNDPQLQTLVVPGLVPDNGTPEPEEPVEVQQMVPQYVELDQVKYQGQGEVFAGAPTSSTKDNFTDFGDFNVPLYIPENRIGEILDEYNRIKDATVQDADDNTSHLGLADFFNNDSL